MRQGCDDQVAHQPRGLQRPFDCVQADVDAAGNQHPAQSAADVQPAIAVDPAGIAGGEPAVGIRTGQGIVQIAGKQHRAAHSKRARVPGVADGDLAAVQRRSDYAGVVQKIKFAGGLDIQCRQL